MKNRIIYFALAAILAGCSEQEEKKATGVQPDPEPVFVNAPGAANMYITEQEAGDYITHFREVFRHKDKDDSLSRSVWFSKDVIKMLNDGLQNKSNNLDGVRLYLAAYDKKVPGTGSEDNNQATIILVPTTDSSGAHADRWNIFKKPTGMDVLNHGQLCPSICNGSTF